MMGDRYAELKELTARFVDAFNRQDLDGVVSFFAEDAVYDDSRGNPHHGPEAIREAFAPLLSGKIRFDDEDYFAELDSEKVMASWTLNLEAGGKPMKMRGLDILQFRGDKIIRKLAYCKADKPRLDEG
ncbi:MAG: nuclear transport factor 2 family protein [Pseudomonadota bacterium]